jgi:hypothetical protein
MRPWLLLTGCIDLEFLLQQPAILWLVCFIWEGWDLGGYTPCNTLPCEIITSSRVVQTLRISACGIVLP